MRDQDLVALFLVTGAVWLRRSAYGLASMTDGLLAGLLDRGDNSLQHVGWAVVVAFKFCLRNQAANSPS